VEAVNKAQQQLSTTEQNEKLQSLLENMHKPEKQKVILKTMDRIYSVPLQDIVRFHSEGSYTEVYLHGGKKIVVSKLIKDFDEMLSNDNFLRVHQSHLVNIDFIFSFEKAENTITMKDDSIVPVSVRRKDTLLSLLNSL
jgi:two-component system LytT family response regulator